MGETVTGGCACGAARYEVEIEDRDAYLCHCRMCQRASGNISLAMKNVLKNKLDWRSGPDWYESSPIARRPYCAKCGTSLGFAFNEGDYMDITIATLDAPEGFTPTHHFGTEHLHEAWLDTSALPRKKTTDYQPLVDRWMDATGSLPE
nr:GFA family protein [Sphingomicrobium nitratireducens]